MKKKLAHLFFAFLTGVIFLLVYFLILSGDYRTVFIKKEILLYTLYVIFLDRCIFLLLLSKE